MATEGKRFHSLERFPSGLSLTPREKDSDAERLSQKGCCAFLIHSSLFAFKNPMGKLEIAHGVAKRDSLVRVANQIRRSKTMPLPFEGNWGGQELKPPWLRTHFHVRRGQHIVPSLCSLVEVGGAGDRPLCSLLLTVPLCSVPRVPVFWILDLCK